MLKFDLTFTPALRMVILSLAAFRLAWLLTKEQGPFAILDKFHTLLDKQVVKEVDSKGEQHHGWRWSLAEVFDCPLCIGVWLAFGLLLIYMNFPAFWIRFVLLALAIAGLQSFLSLLIIKDE